MQERPGAVTFQGAPLTLVGPELKIGDPAPDFNVLDTSLNSMSLAAYKNKTLIISVVPSLDTPVCDIQTKRFNTEASKLGDSVRILTISMDLPFAQARWCGAAGVKNVAPLSDHRDAAFGTAYGLLIKELRLLSRAVLVVDKTGKIAHFELVNEITKEPDYEAAVAAAKAVL